MALLTGMTADGLEVPVQVQPDGKLVAEGLEGPAGKDGTDAAIGGTVLLPGLHPPNDEDTGLFSPAANQLGFATAGVVRLRIGSNGGIAVGPNQNNNIAVYLSKLYSSGVNAYGIVSDGKIPAGVTTSCTAFMSSTGVDPQVLATSALQHFRAEQSAFGAGATVENQYGFQASQTLIGAKTNYGFWAHIPFGTGRWNFYASGTADSWFASNNFILANGGTEKARFNAAGQLLIGRNLGAVGSAAKLQCASTVNLSVVEYADNASAKAAGLVVGDVYRKADGTLMIAF